MKIQNALHLFRGLPDIKIHQKNCLFTTKTVIIYLHPKNPLCCLQKPELSDSYECPPAAKLSQYTINWKGYCYFFLDRVEGRGFEGVKNS